MITHQWANEAHDIILVTYTNPWTWDDFFQAVDDEIVMMKEAQQPAYYIIADFTQSRGLPTGPGITNVAAAFRRFPPELQCVYAVTQERFIRVMINTFQRIHSIFSASLVAVASLQAAYDAIEKHRLN